MKFVKGDWQRSTRATLVMFSTSVAKYYSIAETILTKFKFNKISASIKASIHI